MDFTLYGVITKQIFLICPKFKGKVASQSWKYCINIYVCGQKEYLNRTLEIDLPFQTFAVGLLVAFID